MNDYTVLHFVDLTGNGLTDDDVLTGQPNNLNQSKPSINGKLGGAPSETGEYIAVALYTEEDPIDHVDDTQNIGWGNYTAYKGKEKSQAYEVIEAKKSLEGAVAYEVKAGNSDLSDETLKYDGDANTFAFKANGEKLELDADYKVAWVNGDDITDNSNGTYSVVNAGDYTAKLTGQGAYQGSSATVTVHVAPIDLDSDVVSIDMVDKSTGLTFWVENTVVNKGVTKVKVNGEEVAQGAVFNVEAETFTDAATGTVYSEENNWNNTTNRTVGKWELTAIDLDPNNGNVIGGPQALELKVVDKLATFEYDGVSVTDPSGLDGKVFDASKGTFFNPALLEATVNGEVVDHHISVTRNGEATEDYTQPGEYVLRMMVDVADHYAYGADQTVKFTVIAKHIGDVTTFMSVDGKEYAGSVPYTGEAYEPTVVVKEGKKALVEGEDYEVSYRVKGGEAVESMVEVGDYEIVVSFPGSDRADKPATIDFKIDKAQLLSAEADAEFYALPDDGTAVEPTFTGYTKADLKGQAFGLAADEIEATYYKVTDFDAVNTEKNTAGAIADELISIAEATDAIEKGTGVEKVNADELDEAGWFIASVNVLTTAKNVKGADLIAPFQIAERVAFVDVDANAWYAEYVYKAAQSKPVKYEYMNGIGGSNLFMPEADITRAQTTQVLYNMAGGDDMFDFGGAQYFPTKFSDVSALAWYSKPIYWASEAGVVTGIGDTGTFEPDAAVTREQLATMLYRYAKAQGMDVSGSADLSAYADAGSVSGWAAEAVAWAVAEGVMGVDTDVLAPQDGASRAEVAAMSVRFQPDGAYLPL